MAKSSRGTRRMIENDASQGKTDYELAYEQVWHWLRNKVGWLKLGGPLGFIAWYLTYFHRLYVVLVMSKPHQDKFGFGIPNEAALARLSQLGKLIEVGAGIGYWSWLLRARGVDIIAFDKFNKPGKDGSWFSKGAKNWMEVRQGDTSILSRHPDRILFICYPPSRSSMASDALSAYKGDTFAYVATSQSVAVGDLAFHRQLDAEWELIEVIPIPGWLDFSYRSRYPLRLPRRWREISAPRFDSQFFYIGPLNHGNNLFLFRRKAQA